MNLTKPMLVCLIVALLWGLFCGVFRVPAAIGALGGLVVGGLSMCGALAYFNR